MLADQGLFELLIIFDRPQHTLPYTGVQSAYIYFRHPTIGHFVLSFNLLQHNAGADMHVAAIRGHMSFLRLGGYGVLSNATG